MCSTSTTSVKMLTRGRGVEYKEPSPGSSKIMMSTGKLVFLKDYKFTNLLLCIIFSIFEVLEVKQ